MSLVKYFTMQRAKYGVLDSSAANCKNRLFGAACMHVYDILMDGGRKYSLEDFGLARVQNPENICRIG